MQLGPQVQVWAESGRVCWVHLAALCETLVNVTNQCMQNAGASARQLYTQNTGIFKKEYSFRKEFGIMTCFGFGIFQVTITDDVDTFVQQVTPANFKLRGTWLLRYAHKVIVIWSFKHKISSCLFDLGVII